MENILKNAHESAEYIRTHVKVKPGIGIVLGSGLGSLADGMEERTEIGYDGIPNFPLPTVEGHSGRLISGILSGKPVLVMKGRFHYYEGYEISQVVFAVRVFKLLGIKSLVVTNAAGGINREFKPGDLMLIRDHISLFAPSPLRGRNLEEIGARFPDMSQAYSSRLMDTARRAAAEIGIEIREGVYAFAQGPMYETPAEIRALEVLGADAVGMSTVPEVIAARHACMDVLGISCITNMAAGILESRLNHTEVVKTAAEAELSFKALLGKIMEYWPE